MILMEDDSCDTIVIYAFRPERFDPGEVLKAPAPRYNTGDHFIEVDTKLLHVASVAERAPIICIVDSAEPQGPEWKSKHGLQQL